MRSRRSFCLFDRSQLIADCHVTLAAFGPPSRSWRCEKALRAMRACLLAEDPCTPQRTARSPKRRPLRAALLTQLAYLLLDRRDADIVFVEQLVRALQVELRKPRARLIWAHSGIGKLLSAIFLWQGRG